MLVKKTNKGGGFDFCADRVPNPLAGVPRQRLGAKKHPLLLSDQLYLYSIIYICGILLTNSIVLSTP